MKFEPILIEAPVETPVSLDEIKSHCRVDGDDENDYLAGLIDAAVSLLDGYTGTLGKCLMAQSWSQEFDRWKDFPLCLGPVIALSSIQYFDGSGVAQSLDLQSVRLERRVANVFVCLRAGHVWPDADFSQGPVTVTWQAGYENAAAVPATIKHAIKLMVGHWFESREAVLVGVVASELPMAVDALLSPHRRFL